MYFQWDKPLKKPYNYQLIKKLFQKHAKKQKDFCEKLLLYLSLLGLFTVDFL